MESLPAFLGRSLALQSIFLGLTSEGSSTDIRPAFATCSCNVADLFASKSIKALSL